MNNGYQITHKDFLFIASELNQEIFLCEQKILNQANIDLGIKATYKHLCKKILGFITDKLITIPIESGILKQDKEILAKISCSSLKLEELTPESRIVFEGNIFRFEHKALYTHKGIKIYHDLRLYKSKEENRENIFVEEKNERVDGEKVENYPSSVWDLLK